MKAEEPIRSEDVGRAAREASGHEARAALGALAFDVLSRQAEGRTLFAGREHVEGRAEAHGVARAQATTGAGNLLAILERGAETPVERATVAAFAVCGFGEKLAAAGEGARELCARFVRHADWLEVATPYVVYALVDALLEEGDAALLWAQVADAVLRDAKDPVAPRHDARARNAARLSALAGSESRAALGALGRVAAEADDPPIRALARELGGEPAGDGAPLRLQGRVGSPARGRGRETLRLLTGIAAVGWLLRAVARLVGARREAEVELAPGGGVLLRSRTTLLGRTIRQSEERFTARALAGVTREVRYPRLHLLVGLVALSTGILLGGFLAFDAVRTGDTLLLLIAAAIILVGGGLDLALDVLIPAREGRVSVGMSFLPKRVVRIERVPAEDADRFVEALRRAG